MSKMSTMYLPEESISKLNGFWGELQKRNNKSKIKKKDLIEVLISGYKNPEFNESNFLIESIEAIQ